MKGPAFLLLAFTILVVSAQSSYAQPDPPDLTITKKLWRKEMYHPALSTDPFRANDEQQEMQRVQRDNGIRNSVRVREGTTPQPTVRASRPMSTEGDGGPISWFAYRVTLKNSGTKTITALVWDYLFFNSDNEQVGQHSFQHRVKIRTGKSMEVVGQSNKPPSSVIDASKAKKGEAQLSEVVVIRRIEYEDGSYWQRPLN